MSYDMRISDLSSDRCSSDLTDSDLVFVDPVGTGFSRPVSTDALPAFTSVVGDVAAVTEFIRAWLIQHHAQHRPLIVAGQSYGAGRSEEHTSELQSLMRISYAVFCLKQKTKIHTYVTSLSTTGQSKRT